MSRLAQLRTLPLGGRHARPALVHRGLLSAALLLTCAAAEGCARTSPPASLRSDPPAPRAHERIDLSANRPQFRFFSADSIWNRPVARRAGVDPHSTELVASFDAEVQHEDLDAGGPGINTTTYSVPIYTVPVTQPPVRVKLLAPVPEPALQTAWETVPLPAQAKPAAGSDGHLVLWQPGTERMWEFWRLSRGPEGWQAHWGGAIRNVSSANGVYGPRAWPGAKRSWGASASSLSIAGGLITLQDLNGGRISHALAMAIPNARAAVFAAPAERTDGRSESTLALPEGAHLRLDPNLNIASLHLPRLTRMLAEAAQRYGIIVRDQAARVVFYCQDPTPTGSNPYAGLHGYFEGRSPESLLARFPWSHLQVLRMTLHRGRPPRGAT